MLSWFAIYVQSRHEKFVASLLTNKGFEVCLPLSRTLRQRCDRRTYTEDPIFPSYVFSKFDSELRTPILRTQGVVTILGAGKKPIALEADEVCALQTLERAKTPVEPWPFMAAGQWVDIVDGPLEGLSGPVIECRKGLRILVSVALLQRTVAVEVNRLQIRPVKAPSDGASFGSTAPMGWQTSTTLTGMTGPGECNRLQL